MGGMYMPDRQRGPGRPGSSCYAGSRLHVAASCCCAVPDEHGHCARAERRQPSGPSAKAKGHVMP